MSRYAMVHAASGIVVNLIEWDGSEATWAPPAGYTMVPDDPPGAGVGCSYVDGKFVPPPAGAAPEAPPA